jgi:SAM-dependent methyltransferase
VSKKSSQFTALSTLIADVQETEARYLLHGPRHDPVFTPWMPYQPADFLGIMWECLPQMTGSWFLDVGCGPGTKMQVARDVFGLEVFGIELDPAMAAEANRRVKDMYTVPAVLCGDALAAGPGAYGHYDLIWLYRPFRDAEYEAKLETLIINDMKPGAILAGGSWETDIPALGWQPIVDDCLHDPQGSGAQIFRGAWQKPSE